MNLSFWGQLLEYMPLTCGLIIYAPALMSLSLPPLNDLRGQLQPDHAEAIAKKIFHSVAEELNENYPGGCERAEEELKAWLMQSN